MPTVVIGNSGSGKTWLAKRLAAKAGSSVTHLDDVFWLPGGFDERRDPLEVSGLVDAKRVETLWIVEGVYGNLASQFLPSVPTLVWVDLPWHVCKQRLELRGSESKAHMGGGQSDLGLQELLGWAEAYGSRPGSSSEAAHRALFEAFEGQRFRLRSAAEVGEFLNSAWPATSWPPSKPPAWPCTHASMRL